MTRARSEVRYMDWHGMTVPIPQPKKQPGGCGAQAETPLANQNGEAGAPNLPNCLPIGTAPTSGCFLAINVERKQFGVVTSAGREWELLDMAGNRMGVGFYPTHWMPGYVPAPKGGLQ